MVIIRTRYKTVVEYMHTILRCLFENGECNTAYLMRVVETSNPNIFYKPFTPLIEHDFITYVVSKRNGRRTYKISHKGVTFLKLLDELSVYLDELKVRKE